MLNKQLQIDLKDVTVAEFQDMLLPDAYVFAKFDFQVPSKPPYDFRLHYGHWISTPRLSLRGPVDAQVFDQAYFVIGQALAQLSYGEQDAMGAMHMPSEHLSRPFQLHEQLTKHDLSVIVNNILLPNFSVVTVPFVSLQGVSIDDIERYNIPEKKISQYFQ